MILLTGRGALADSLANRGNVTIISMRKIEDADLIEYIKKSEVIIHNAALISSTDSNELLSANFDSTKRLITLIKEHHPTLHFILISSMSILNPKNSELYLPEESMTSYAHSKYLAEKHTLESGLPWVTCIRFSTIFYGQSERDGLSRLISDAITNNEISIFNDGTAKRDFIPIDVVSQYIHKVARQTLVKKSIYNIVSGNQTSFYQVAQTLEELVPNLKINNIQTASGIADVLSNFNTDSVNHIGIVKFTLQSYIEEYIKRLRS